MFLFHLVDYHRPGVLRKQGQDNLLLSFPLRSGRFPVDLARHLFEVGDMFTVPLTSMMKRCSSPLIPCCIIVMLCIYILSEWGPRNSVIEIYTQILFADFVKGYTKFTGFVICRGCDW
jgi:hypothetical protein